MSDDAPFTFTLEWLNEAGEWLSDMRLPGHPDRQADSNEACFDQALASLNRAYLVLAEAGFERCEGGSEVVDGQIVLLYRNEICNAERF